MNSAISFHPGDIPQKPGIYIFRDRFGEVIYVGKASNLRKRMSHYFQRSRSTLADPKLRSLINSIDSWEVMPVKNESESLILESRLIKVKSEADQAKATYSPSNDAAMFYVIETP